MPSRITKLVFHWFWQLLLSHELPTESSSAHQILHGLKLDRVSSPPRLVAYAGTPSRQESDDELVAENAFEDTGDEIIEPNAHLGSLLNECFAGLENEWYTVPAPFLDEGYHGVEECALG